MSKVIEKLNLEEILEKAYQGQFLLKSEIVFLLGLNDQNTLNRLFQTARALRFNHFKDKIFLYGFLYFSTWCRNDCAFCYYRKSNLEIKRYRKTSQEILEAALRLAESGVHLIDLTMGEDPVYFQKPAGFDSLIQLVRQIKIQTGLPIMVSPGVAPNRVLLDLAAAGADFYACYQETHNRQLFKELRLDQSYDRRLFSKKVALQNGLLVEEGMLIGVGESSSDIANSMIAMRNLGVHQVRAMSFVPQEGSLMKHWATPTRILELKIIAILRLLFPDRLIPASLDIDGVEGLETRLNAGANVVTSLIQPSLGFAGVAQNSKDIDEGNRTVEGILPHLEKLGLVAANASDFTHWVQLERDKLATNPGMVTGD